MSDFISELFEGSRAASLEKDETLFRAGDPVRFMYLVVEGQVYLVRHSSEGERMNLHRAASGQVLAEASAYSGIYHCDGTAAEAARLRAIPVAVFRDRLDKDTGLSNAWSERLAHALQESRTNAEIRSLRTVSERLDAWLGANRSLPPKGQWQHLAQALGVTREALYRELAKRHR